MEVAAHLPLPLLAHLRVVLSPHHAVTPVDGWRALEDAIRSRPLDAIVVDPFGSGELRVPEIRRLRVQYPSVPIVVYTLLAPTAVKGVMELAASRIEHVVLHRFDDEPRRFRTLLEGLRGVALGDLLLARIAVHLTRLPEGVAQTIELLFREPGRFPSVPAIASDARISLRMFYRYIEQAGLAAPRQLLAAARLLKAYGYLQDPGSFVEDVALRVGYSEARILTRQLHAATGLRTSALLRNVPTEQFLAMLVHRVRIDAE
ncbi:MAG TPA: hypothetical protein VMM18_03760 [Gemmatimonadaceae bacterium]|nr:hypothetical protein [Gemmatimonadaceae bacterium]